VVADIKLRLMSTYTTKNKPKKLIMVSVLRSRNATQDVNPLQKFRPSTDTKVNHDFNGQTVRAI